MTEACERRAGMSDYLLRCWPNSPNRLPCFTFITPDSNAVAHFRRLQTCTECVSICETSPHYSRQSGQQCLHADIMKTPQRPGEGGTVEWEGKQVEGSGKKLPFQGGRKEITNFYWAPSAEKSPFMCECGTHFTHWENSELQRHAKALESFSKTQTELKMVQMEQLHWGVWNSCNAFALWRQSLGCSVLL